MRESVSDSAPSGLIPGSARELLERLNSLRELTPEEVAFTVAGVLYLVGRSGGLMNPGSSETERFSLFMSFSSALDPRMDPDRTFQRISGRFLNYAADKLRLGGGGLPCLSRTLLERLVFSLEEALSDESSAERVMKGLLGVRDASYVYVHFSSRFGSLFEGAKRELGCEEARGSRGTGGGDGGV